MDYEPVIIRSRRKSLQVEVHNDLSVIVRAPKWVSLREINRFIDERRDWIEEALARAKKRIDDNPVPDRYSEYELQKLAEQARKTIPPLVEKYADEIGVKYSRVTIRTQKTRWGSCSSKGNLNFNCLLMLLPEPVMNYVIVHELCHIKEMNHSPAFWREVEKHCPDYRYLRDFLQDNGEKVLLRL